MAKKQNDRDNPYKWAGKVGVDSGPVPLSRWSVNPTQVTTKASKAQGESKRRTDLRSERK